ncbi:hypothetical protein [Burkholderia sp. PAMC 26561]|uniref:hypothetical protein n=1 Tax=Burkholderia sp. PAMC 26561 TaxID=1795043 RepID=UPI00076B160F|nr:hypothetical protein [Burkholderia sp. PAMC 26561]AME22898.1 hypothetical protein AXG89_02705 [Burkholderia sp. PAMC 26561]
MKPAIALLCYTRVKYFELTLASILNQKIDGRDVSDFFDIYVFQDGLPEGASDEDVKRHSEISAIVENSNIAVIGIKQEKNLGIGLHFDFIERFLFIDKGYAYANFFEDDLILCPGYLKTMKLLQDKFQDDSRVGMVSASPAGFQRSSEEQLSGLYDYDNMGHSWAFGLAKKSWLRRQPFVDEYLGFIRNVRYESRPNVEIQEWLKSHGIQENSTSQDYVKQAAIVKAGEVCLSTFANYGFYIGRDGANWDREAYASKGFQRSVICPKQLDKVVDLSAVRFEELRAAQSFSFTLDAVTPTTNEDVAAAYRIFLGRNPENLSVVEEMAKRARHRVIELLMCSEEFLSSPLSRKLIVEVYDHLKKWANERR